MSKNRDISYCYSISPTYICRYMERKSYIKIDEVNKYENLNKGYKNKNDLSKTTIRKIKKSCEWLYMLSENKIHKDKAGTKYLNYKCSMITLTLSSTQTDTDTFITKKMLGLFLQNMRDKYDFRNYVWRAERQKNGNIHYHIITDSEVNYYVIRYVWNKIQNKFGYLKDYKEKYSKMPWKDYLKENKSRIEVIKKNSKIKIELDEKKLYKSYLLCKKQNWEMPNSVDVKYIVDKKTLFNYIAKYICKDEKKDSENENVNNEVSKINGRIWSCSQSISKMKDEVNKNKNFIEYAYYFAKTYMEVEEIAYDYHDIVLVDFIRLVGWCKSKFGNVIEIAKKNINYLAGKNSKKLKIHFYTKHFGLLDFNLVT